MFHPARKLLMMVLVSGALAAAPAAVAPRATKTVPPAAAVSAEAASCGPAPVAPPRRHPLDPEGCSEATAAPARP
jgi:hypothetical protein